MALRAFLVPEEEEEERKEKWALESDGVLLGVYMETGWETVGPPCEYRSQPLPSFQVLVSPRLALHLLLFLFFSASLLPHIRWLTGFLTAFCLLRVELRVSGKQMAWWRPILASTAKQLCEATACSNVASSPAVLFVHDVCPFSAAYALFLPFSLSSVSLAGVFIHAHLCRQCFSLAPRWRRKHSHPKDKISSNNFLVSSIDFIVCALAF